MSAQRPAKSPPEGARHGIARALWEVELRPGETALEAIRRAVDELPRSECDGCGATYLGTTRGCMHCGRAGEGEEGA